MSLLDTQLLKCPMLILLLIRIYAKRVRQLGENPKKYFFKVGGFGVDVIKNTKFLSRKN